MCTSLFRPVLRRVLSLVAWLPAAAPAVAAQMALPVPAESTARPTPARADSAPHTSWRHDALLLGAGAVAAATTNQVIGSPDDWSRTPRGYSWRVADQLGFGAVEEVVRIGVTRALPWEPDTRPCRASGSASTSPARLSLLAGVRCAARQTLLLRTRDGAARPNVAFGTAMLAAAITSTVWRPEAKTTGGAVKLVALRTSIASVTTVLSQGLFNWYTARER